jgi:hypothetical protein
VKIVFDCFEWIEYLSALNMATSITASEAARALAIMGRAKGMSEAQRMASRANGLRPCKEGKKRGRPRKNRAVLVSVPQTIAN